MLPNNLLARHHETNVCTALETQAKHCLADRQHFNDTHSTCLLLVGGTQALEGSPTRRVCRVFRQSWPAILSRGFCLWIWLRLARANKVRETILLPVNLPRRMFGGRRHVVDRPCSECCYAFVYMFELSAAKRWVVTMAENPSHVFRRQCVYVCARFLEPCF